MQSSLFSLAGTLQQAEEAINASLPNATVDMNLRGTSTVELAIRLRHKGVKVAFLTGGNEDDVPDAIKDTPVFNKPAVIEDLIEFFSQDPSSARN